MPSYFYMDTDAGSDASDGTTWANAKLTLEGLIAVLTQGDIGFVQGAAADTAAASRTFTPPSTANHTAAMIIGVADGTTNTGASIVASDLASTLPLIQATGASSDIIFGRGALHFMNLKFDAGDQYVTSINSCHLRFTNCYVKTVDDFHVNGQAFVEWINTDFESTATTADIKVLGVFEWRGGTFIATTQPTTLFATQAKTLDVLIIGVDLSALTNPLTSTTAMGGMLRALHCKIESSLALYQSTPGVACSFVEVIGSSDATSIGNTSSVQDYQYQDHGGSIDDEVTVVRTGGADDKATGLFSYAITPYADRTIESGTCVRSPWISKWIAGGASKTITLHIANSSASTDYNEDEAWVEWYTPDDGDTPQHDQFFTENTANDNDRLLNSSTAITDDTGSTWGSGGNNHQKFSITTTPGFEGWVFARLHVAKKQTTPDTVYLDPLLEAA